MTHAHIDRAFYVVVRVDQGHPAAGAHTCTSRAHAWRLASELASGLRGTTGSVIVRDGQRRVLHRWTCSDPAQPYHRERSP